MSCRCRVFFLLLSVFLTQPSKLVAQTPPAQDELERLKKENERLKLEKEKAELEASIAKAEKDRFKSALPETKVTPPEGKTTVADSKIEGASLAYRAARTVACQVAKEIGAKGPKALIIHNQVDVNSVQQYRAIRMQMDFMSQQYKTLVSPPPTAFTAAAALLGPDAAAAILGSIAGVIALFRTDTEIKGFDVTLEESAVVAELKAALAKPDCVGAGESIDVLYPGFYPPLKHGGDPLTASHIISTLLKLHSSRKEAESRVKDCDQKGANCGDDDAKKHALLKALNTQLDVLTAALTKVDDKTGLSLLASLLKAESVFDSLGADGRVLFIKASHAGGSNRTTRNLWTNFGSAVLSHRGGAVITYILFAADGKVELAGTHACVTPYNGLEDQNEARFVCDFNRPGPRKK
jgi:hypothetical protein